ncbi:MAG: flagellar biosynthesis protein FlgL [Xanthobacteraceae bacterium]|nr:flagellar biosynthesis protein FlgL [Xanthobacteraceae bacterium]QYK44082.1 MAG: flagellar biosynthesis protein FlgL [Xanthobacteraceae bacterium]
MSSISGTSLTTTMAARTISQMRDQLSELQRQLGTGKKSDTYGGLGLGSGLVLNLRAQLTGMSVFSSNSINVQTRVSLMNTSLQRIGDLRDETRSDLAAPFDFTLVQGGQSAAQRSATGRLSEMLSLLNLDAGGRYLFSGRATDKPATDTMTRILNGEGAQAGLKQIISERLQADQGADLRGRIQVNAAAGSIVSLAEDGTHPFGFKITGATTSFGATITGPAGAPPSLSVDLGATNPPANGTVRITLAMPDGTSTAIELTATTANPPGDKQFTIGATPADTAANLTAAMDTELQRLAQVDLAAASAIQAGNDFFATDASNPPQRVAGPPFATAIAMVDGTPANTISWYLGDNNTDNARDTSIARVDDAITVSYGARANEEGIRWIVQNTAVFAAVGFSDSDLNARDRYYALAGRVGAAMNVPSGMQQIEAIQTEIAGANVSAQSAKQRIAERQPLLQDMIDGVENISDEEISVKLLALNTRMQASLQVTAMLSQLSLVNYI